MLEKKDLKKPIKNLIISMSIPVILSFSSGITLDNSYAKDKDSLLVPQTAYEDIMLELDPNGEKITKSMLENAKELCFKISKEDSLEFLKNCKKLEKLRIVFVESETEILKTFPKMNTLKELDFVTMDTKGLIEDPTVFTRVKNVEKIGLYGTSLGPNTIENCKKLETLEIYRTRNLDVDLNKTSIKTLDLSGCGPYDIPVFLDSKDYKKLDMEVVFKNDKTKEKYLSVSKQLRKIVKDLNLNGKTDKEKIAKVVAYVLKNMEYDEEVTNDYENKGGTLKEPLKNKRGVCQNYADFTKVLLEKAGVDTYVISSDYHSFDVVNVDGTNYIYDPTWLDSGSNKKMIKNIKRGKGEKYIWYHENSSLEHMNELDESGNHNYIGYPNYMDNKVKKLVRK